MCSNLYSLLLVLILRAFSRSGDRIPFVHHERRRTVASLSYCNVIRNINHIKIISELKINKIYFFSKLFIFFLVIIW